MGWYEDVQGGQVTREPEDLKRLCCGTMRRVAGLGDSLALYCREDFRYVALVLDGTESFRVPRCPFCGAYFEKRFRLEVGGSIPDLPEAAQSHLVQEEKDRAIAFAREQGLLVADESNPLATLQARLQSTACPECKEDVCWEMISPCLHECHRWKEQKDEAPSTPDAPVETSEPEDATSGADESGDLKIVIDKGAETAPSKKGRKRKK